MQNSYKVISAEHLINIVSCYKILFFNENNWREKKHDKLISVLNIS